MRLGNFSVWLNRQLKKPLDDIDLDSLLRPCFQDTVETRNDRTLFWSMQMGRDWVGKYF